MRPTVLLSVVAALAGAGAAVWYATNKAPAPVERVERAAALPAPLAVDDIDDESLRRIAQAVDSLSGLLEQEINERRAQADEIAALKRQLDDFDRKLGTRVAMALSGDSLQTPAPTDDEPSEEDDTAESRLVAAGFSEAQIAEFERFQVEAQLDRIALDDRARREGWANTPRHFSEVNAVANPMQSVRNALSEPEYDRFLHAVGQPNRVGVAMVIATSAADQAGLEAGDVIMSYGGERIWATNELTQLRSEGESGAPTSVEILRDGVPMTLTIPRGPMGITTVPQYVDPSK